MTGLTAQQLDESAGSATGAIEDILFGVLAVGGATAGLILAPEFTIPVLAGMYNAGIGLGYASGALGIAAGVAEAFHH